MPDQVKDAEDATVAIGAVGGSMASLITVVVRQGPSAVISAILCWGIFVTVPNIVTEFSKVQDKLRDTFATQADKQREFFSVREDLIRKSHAEEFKQLIDEQKALTKELSETNDLVRSKL